MNISIIISVRPRVSPFSLSKFASETQKPVDLYCNVLAYPSPTYTWTRPDVLGFTQQDRGTRKVFTVGYVSEEDYGSYVCTATNEAGATSFTVMLQKPGEIK